MTHLWLVRKTLAAASSLLIVVSYVTCIIIAKTRDTYTGGLAMPYFSDTGRDKETGLPYPQVGGYYVFAVFNTVAACLMLVFMVLQFLYMKAWFQNVDGVSYKCRATTALVFGVVAPICAMLLSIFDTSSYPDLHNYSAYVFFLTIILFGCFTLSLFHTLSKHFEDHRRLLVPRYIVMAVLGIAFIIYIPVGLAITTWKELSYDECVVVQAEQFCQEHLKAGSNLTDLWDYSEDRTENLMRSSTQFICIISVMSFIFIHAFDPNPHSLVDIEEGRK